LSRHADARHTPRGPWPAGPGPLPPQLPSFTERVMARIEEEPRPSAARAFAVSLARLRLGDASAAVRTAWRLAFERTRPVAPRVRFQSLVLVLPLGLLVSAGGAIAATGALRVLEATRPPGERSEAPANVRSSPAPSPHPSSMASLEPTAAPPGQVERTRRPDASDDPARRRLQEGGSRQQGQQDGPAETPQQGLRQQGGSGGGAPRQGGSDGGSAGGTDGSSGQGSRDSGSRRQGQGGATAATPRPTGQPGAGSGDGGSRGTSDGASRQGR
jgi:uncharacterized membrane protein YgcG